MTRFLTALTLASSCFSTTSGACTPMLAHTSSSSKARSLVSGGRAPGLSSSSSSNDDSLALSSKEDTSPASAAAAAGAQALENVATAGATAAYISQVGTKYPPGSGLGSGQAADAGDDIQLFGFGDICSITVGSGAGVTHGDPLSVTTGGTAITSATPGTSVVCAYALESGAANTLVRCQICVPHLMITSEQ